MQHILQAAVAAEIVPFAVAARVSADGVVESACSGGANADSIFRMASMTKAITSVAVLQLVERAMVALDAPAETYLDGLRGRQVLTGFDRDGAPRLRDPASKPTIRQLLTHTAGFGYSIWNADLQRMEQHLGLSMSRGLSDRMLELPMIADPGTRWEYGINTDLLGAIVEAVTGQRLDRYFDEHLFGPLNMPDTHFNVPQEKQARVLPVFTRAADGLAKLAEGIPPATFLSGGGGLASTASDYARFLQVILRHGELDGRRILEPDTVDLMAKPHTGTLPIPPMLTADPFYSADCDFLPGQPKRWGLGFLINTEDVAGRRRAGSLSWAGVFNTHYWIDRQAGIAGLLLTQLLPFCDPGFLRLYDDVERAMYEAT